MKTIMCCIMFSAICPALAEDIRQSSAAPAGIVVSSAATEVVNTVKSTGTLKTPPVQVSEGMMKRIRELEKEVAEEKGQDDAALERISAKIYWEIVAIPPDEELIAAIKDVNSDWRIRYLLLFAKSNAFGEKGDKYAGDFTEILRDKSQHERIRGVSALILSDIAKKDDAVKKVLTEVAKASDTPGEVLNSVMAVVGQGGIDDADALIRVMERNPSNFNEIGINLNAIRALGKSKDPKAFSYLVKIFDESVPDSLFNSVAIETFWSFVRNPETLERVKPVIVPRLLKLLDDRSRIGMSRDDAAAILAELQVQEAVEPLLRWYLPANRTEAQQGGGEQNGYCFWGHGFDEARR